MNCLQCGASLVERPVDSRLRLVCPACAWVYYRQLKVGAGTLVVADGRLLLLQRHTAPFAGAWNLPAGYVEADEDPRRAAERETLEESGLQVRAGRLLEAYYFEDDPRGPGLLLVYIGEVLAGRLRLNAESATAGYFGPREMPEPLAGGGHAPAIRAWVASLC